MNEKPPPISLPPINAAANSLDTDRTIHLSTFESARTQSNGRWDQLTNDFNTLSLTTAPIQSNKAARDTSIENLGVMAKWRNLEERHRKRMESRVDRTNMPLDECRETFVELIHMFPVFGPLLEAIKAEYETYITAGEEAQRNAHMIQMQLESLDKPDDELMAEVDSERKRIDELKAQNDELKANLNKLEIELEMQKIQEENSRHVGPRFDQFAREHQWMEIVHLEDQVRAYKRQIIEIRDQLKSRYVPLVLKTWLEENVHESQNEIERLQDVLAKKDEEIAMIKANISRLVNKLSGFSDHPSVKEGQIDQILEKVMINRKQPLLKSQTLPAGARLPRDFSSLDSSRPPTGSKADWRTGTPRKQSIVTASTPRSGTNRRESTTASRRISVGFAPAQNEDVAKSKQVMSANRPTRKKTASARLWPIVQTLGLLERTRKRSMQPPNQKTS